MKKYKLNFLLLFSWLFIINVNFVFSQDHFKACQNIDSVIASQNLAESLRLEWNKNAISRSIDIFTEVSACWEKKQDFEKAAFNLRQAGNLNAILGNNYEALRLLLKALKLTNKLENPDEQINVLSELSLLSLNTGQINLSKNYLDKALFLSGKTENNLSKTAVSFCEAEFTLFQRNLPKAIDLYVKALEFSRKAGDPKLEAKILLYLGYGYLYQGENNRAYETLSNGLILFQKIGDKRGEAFNKIAIANTLAFMDKRQEAINFYKSVESTFPDDLDFIEKAKVYNGFASINEQYEEWSVSIGYRTKALALFRQVNFKYGELPTLIRIGKLQVLNGEESSALEFFSKAEKLAYELNDKLYIALVQKELGNIYFQTGENKTSLEKYQQSIKLLKQIKSNRQLALVYDEIGKFYAKQNDIQMASEYFENGLKLHQTVKDSFAESYALYNLAKLNASIENKEDAALSYIRGSLDITENLYSDVLNSKLKSAYLSNVFDRYELYINLLMNMHKQSPNGNYATQALQATEKSRARFMLETLALSEANITRDADPQLIRREQETRNLLNLKADKLTDLLSNNSDKAVIDKLDSEINELKNELEEIKATLKQNSPVYSTIKNPAPFDVNEFQNNVLDNNTLLLEFSFGKDESYLWLIGKKEINSYVLPAREEIESRIEKIRDLLLTRQIKRDVSIENYQEQIATAERLYKHEAQFLSDELLGQVTDRIDGKRLIIVADGKLNLFPIAALPRPNSNSEEPILLKNEVIYEPSASTLLFQTNSRNNLISPKKNLIVFADPIFSAKDERLSSDAKSKDTENPDQRALSTFRFAESLDSLPRLLESHKEANSIAEIVGISKSDIFSGSDANLERALNPSTADYKIIHFATHSYLNEERPELSAIVLSQFNELGEKQNGLLRLQDIYSLDLNSDLVVLSACNTGNGKEVKGEGLMSLNNAFLQVGAKSVLSSLWKVDDNATKELMKNFYQGLTSENLTASEALRRAQIVLAQNPQYKSPFYWAAFTIQGDFQNAPKLSSGFNSRIYFLFLVPFLIFGIYRLLRAGSFHRKAVNHS